MLARREVDESTTSLYSSVAFSFTVLLSYSNHQETKKALSFDNAFIRVGVEGLKIPLTRRAMDKSTPSLRSGGSFFLFVLI